MSDELFVDVKKLALEIQKKEISIIVPAYDYIDILTGQVTIGLEILEDLEDVHAVVVKDDGGLIGGIAYIIKTLKPTCKVYGEKKKVLHQ